MEQELENSTGNGKVIFWAVVFIACILILICAVIVLGKQVAMLMLTPPAWLWGYLAIVSPFHLVEAIGNRTGKNLAFLRLIPGSIFVAFAGRFITMTFIEGFFVLFLLVFYSGIPLAVSYWIVHHPLKQRRLRWKSVIIVYSIALFAGAMLHIATIMYESPLEVMNNEVQESTSPSSTIQLREGWNLFENTLYGYSLAVPDSWVKKNNEYGNPTSFQTPTGESIVFSIQPDRKRNARTWFSLMHPSVSEVKYFIINGVEGAWNEELGVAYIGVRSKFILMASCQDDEDSNSSTCKESIEDFKYLLQTVR